MHKEGKGEREMRGAEKNRNFLVEKYIFNNYYVMLCSKFNESLVDVFQQEASESFQ